MSPLRWRRGPALISLLLLCSGRVCAAAPENFFAALDAAAVVATCQVDEVARAGEARLVIFHVGVRDVLKGELPPATASLPVVQELLFPSDVPSPAKGAGGLCILKTMPNYSAYRTVLTNGPYFQFSNREKPLVLAATAAVAKQWLALSQVPSNERAEKRVQVLLDHVGDAVVGQDALSELGGIAELATLLERVGYERIGAVLRDTRIGVEQRRALLTLLADHQVTGALPVLRSIQDPALAPFLHQSIVALGASVPLAQLRADLNAGTEDQRLAGVTALATLAARSKDAKLRSESVALLAKTAEHDASEAVRLAAIDQLGKMGNDGLAAIEPLLAQHEAHVVYAAGRALGAIGSPAATRMLAQQFKQGSYDAQVAAVFGLREIATPEAMRLLAEVKANPPDPRLPRVIDIATGKEPGHE